MDRRQGHARVPDDQAGTARQQAEVGSERQVRDEERPGPEEIVSPDKRILIGCPILFVPGFERILLGCPILFVPGFGTKRVGRWSFLILVVERPPDRHTIFVSFEVWQIKFSTLPQSR